MAASIYDTSAPHPPLCGSHRDECRLSRVTDHTCYIPHHLATYSGFLLKKFLSLVVCKVVELDLLGNSHMTSLPVIVTSLPALCHFISSWLISAKRGCLCRYPKALKYCA